MANGECAFNFSDREDARQQEFTDVWTDDLNGVFADVAKYYERANFVASMGLWNWIRGSFLDMVELESGQRILDVCAGTNATGIGLLRKQPDLEVHAMDRSEAMQEEGQKLATAQGMQINSVIGDVHTLPFPDNYFDVVTLQYASRHLRIMDVIKEIKRILKPGGHFYHGDMLRPANKIVETLYYTYLRFCLTGTALLFRSQPVSFKCRDYFVDALRMFYSADEFSQLLGEVGFQQVVSKPLLGGTIGFHKAHKSSSS